MHHIMTVSCCTSDVLADALTLPLCTSPCCCCCGYAALDASSREPSCRTFDARGVDAAFRYLRCAAKLHLTYRLDNPIIDSRAVLPMFSLMWPVFAPVVLLGCT